MVLAIGPIVQQSILSNSAVLTSPAATGGTGPYTYQWYRSTTTGFSPGGGTLIAGATALSLTDTGLIPNTIYYYKIRATDTGDSNTTADSAQSVLTTSGPSQNPNAFDMSPTLGMVDLPYNTNTVAVMIDASETGTLYQGSPVKIVDSAGGIPKVVKCAANTDNVMGFINYNIKNQAFVAGMPCEISMAANVIFLYATGPIARGVRVVLDLLNNGVAAASGSGGENIVGWAYDKAAAQGELIRIKLLTPSFTFDA